MANTPEWGAELMDEHFDPVVLRLIELLKKALPDCAEEDIFWGYHFVTGALMLTLARTGRIDKLSGGLCKSEDFAAVKERMATFMAAGFLAICKQRQRQARRKVNADVRSKGACAIVTGAGGGLGREHALFLARQGARVVVNDLGAGCRRCAWPREIVAAGGEAIAIRRLGHRRGRDRGDGRARTSPNGAASTSWSTTPASCATRASPR